MDEGLRQLNIIYVHSLHELEHTFLLPVPESRKGLFWPNIQSFVRDMYGTLNDPKCGYNTLVECAVLKTMYAVKNILDHHGDLSEATSETLNVIRKIKNMP